MSWPTWRLFTSVRAVCGARVLLVVLSLFLLPLIFFFFLLMLCICFVCHVFLFSFFCFFLEWKRGRAHTAGTGMGNWCSGAIVLFSLVCVVRALVAAAPQGCGSRVLMYTGTGQGGFG